MEQKRAVPIWVRVILVALCVAVFVFDVRGMLNMLHSTVSFGYVCFAAYGITVLFALVYCACGLDKASSRFYTWMIAFFAVTMFLSVLQAAMETVNDGFFPVLPATLAFGALCVLTIAKDLGKTKSFVLAFVVLLSSVAYSGYGIANHGIKRVGEYAFSIVLLSAVLCIMVYAKYADKASRGR